MSALATRLVPILILLGACSEPVEEYNVSQSSIGTFQNTKKEIALRVDYESPVASLIRPENAAEAPLGVSIWTPETLLIEMGVFNGSIVSRVNGKSPYDKFEEQWQLTGKPFENGLINHGPYNAESEKYVQFADYLIAELRNDGLLSMDIYTQYTTRADLDKHGLFSSKPRKVEVTLTQ